ncbi:MAG: ATP-binding protein [Verrucomicrobiota bacterium]
MKFFGRSFRLLCLLAVFSGIAEGKILRIGIYNNAPMIYFEEEQAGGIFIEFLQSVAAAEGWELIYRYDSFSGLMNLLERGEIDVLPCIASSYERLKIYGFNRQPIIDNWAVLIRRKDVVINNFFDLEGKRVLSLRGDIHQKALRELLQRYRISCEIIEVDDYSLALQGLDSGKGDVAAVSRTFSSRKGGLFDSPSTLLIFNPVPLHYAFPKGRHHDVIHALDRAYELQSKDPDSPLQLSMAQLLKPEQALYLPAWTYWTGGFLLVLAIALAVLVWLLRVLVNRRTAELDAETTRAKEALRAQNLFLATLSHELRTPLNHLAVPLGMLRQDYVHQQETTTMLDTCIRGIERLQHLILSLLRFAKVEREDFELAREEVDLEKLFEEIIPVLRAMPREESVELVEEVRLDSGLHVITDEDALFQITLNLVHNALKYTESGRVLLRVEYLVNDELLIKVEDTGIGIPQQDIDAVFTPFLRGTSAKYVESGVGLGLSIVKRFVEAFSGSIDLKSEEGKGTTFQVRLPIKKNGL